LESEGRSKAVGDLDHVYYWVTDMEAAVAFYTDVLGLTPRMRTGNEWAEFDAPPVVLALHGSDGQLPGSGTVVFRVSDLDRSRSELSQRGAVFDDHIGEVEGHARFATFRDPSGNPLQIIEYLH
jgi:catechol 2,3-dioxygenase-like lactoylglutathione lyase family enzyme